MLARLKQIAELRYRISAQMYFAMAGAVALTIAASVVGWISFNRVDTAQQSVIEEAIPELGAAFKMAEYSGTLAAAAPRLVASSTEEDIDFVSAEITRAQLGFEEQMILLQQSQGDSAFETIRTNAQTILFQLLFNIKVLEGTMPVLFELNDKSEALRLELIDLRTRLDDIIIPAIDDQLFYLMTGYTELGEPPIARDIHYSTSEFNRYRHLADIRAETNLATQLLSSAFSVANSALIVPLQESFESTESRLRISVSSLGDPLLLEEINPILTRLFAMGDTEDDGFDLLFNKHQLEDQQENLLNENRTLALELVDGVDGLVAHSQNKATTSNAASQQALQTGRTLLLVISGVGVLGALLISWGFVGQILLKRIGRLSEQMRNMAEGDLEEQVDVKGRDEVAEMAAALEIFRRHALEVQRLNLVEKLAEELSDKNSQLEEVLEELQRAQDQIVMREKLVALGEVTAGVAHEIRNPLNFIKNFSEVTQELIEELQEIIEDIEDAIPEDDKEYLEEVLQDMTDNLERIQNHSGRANRIVRDMLLMGRGGGEFRPIDLNQLFNEHALLAYHSARATDTEFQLDLQRDFDPDMGEIEAIPQDLGRTFLNLVGNSCYATHKKRLALMESQPDETFYPIITLKTRREGDKAIVSVRDNGSGMPPEVQEKIFNPFFTTKPTDEGTGLGLALSNDIIREHGGTITVESEEGEFTEMIIELPLTRTEISEIEGN